MGGWTQISFGSVTSRYLPLCFQHDPRDPHNCPPPSRLPQTLRLIPHSETFTVWLQFGIAGFCGPTILYSLGTTEEHGRLFCYEALGLVSTSPFLECFALVVKFMPAKADFCLDLQAPVQCPLLSGLRLYRCLLNHYAECLSHPFIQTRPMTFSIVPDEPPMCHGESTDEKLQSTSLLSLPSHET